MSARLTRLCALALTCVVAGGLALAAPAGAAGHHASTAGQHPSGAVPRAGSHLKIVPTTDQGAGYWLYPTTANGLASVSTTFTMPSFSCVHSNDQEWLLPGIWVFASGTLTEQVDVNFNCNTGTVLREGYACLTDGCGTALTPAVGDTMIASLAYTPTATVATLKDVTQGTKTQFVGAARSDDDVVLVGDVGPDWFFGGIVKKVPQFAPVTFRQVQLNGEYLVDGPFPTQYNLKTGTSLQITTTAILPDGESFTTKFKHS
jgi:hypothetical protein